VRLALKETASSIYSFATSDYNANIAAGSNLASGGFVIAAPTSLSVATDTTTNDNLGTTSVTVTWVNSASPMVIFTDVQFKRNGAADATYTSTTASKGSTKQTILGLEIGVAYNFRVRHAGVAGSYSAFSSVVNHTVGGTAVATTTISNSNITVNSTTGIIENIGTSSIKVNNEKITVDGDGKLIGIGTSNIIVDNTELASSDITGGLGFTPYNATNPSGYAGDQSLPTHTTSTSDPSGSAVSGSTHYKTGVTPPELWIYGTSWVHQEINTNTQLTIGTGSGHALAGNTSIPPDLRVDGAGTVHANNYTDTTYTLPNGVLIGHPTISGTTITFPSNDGGSSTVVTQDTNTTYTFVDSLTASPSKQTLWTSSDGAYYSPSGTTQDVTVTYYNGISTDECVIRWTYTAVAFSTADFITSVAEQTDSNNKFTIGSISPSSATNRKAATVVVTHTASSATITLGCLLSIVGVAGGGK
jgi:hypothetical protein